MKQLVLLIAVSMVLFSCSSNNAGKQAENLAIAKKYMEAIETKNVAIMDSLMSPAYIGYGPSVGDSVSKEEALESFKYNAENLYESYKYAYSKEMAVSVTEGDGIGDWVLNWARLTIKYKDGRGPINLWVNAIYRIENGKIVLSRTFYNEADALRQLGYTFEPPVVQ